MVIWWKWEKLFKSCSKSINGRNFVENKWVVKSLPKIDSWFKFHSKSIKSWNSTWNTWMVEISFDIDEWSKSMSKFYWKSMNGQMPFKIDGEFKFYLKSIFIQNRLKVEIPLKFYEWSKFHSTSMNDRSSINNRWLVEILLEIDVDIFAENKWMAKFRSKSMKGQNLILNRWMVEISLKIYEWSKFYSKSQNGWNRWII